MEQPIERPIDPTEPDGPKQVEETGSLSEFAERFPSKDTKASPREREPEDDELIDRTPRKGKSAKPDDRRQIAALTKRLREAEAKIGVKTDRLPDESDRAYNLRLRAEAAEAVATQRQQPAPRVEPQTAPKAPTFGEAEPTIEQFKDAADPYSAWQRAVNAYDRHKERFDEQQKQVQTEPQRRAEANRTAAYHTYKERIGKFKADTPDYDAVIAKADLPCPPLLETALVNMDDGPRYGYLLAKNHELGKNPEIFHELFLAAENKPVTRQTVEALQSLIKARMPVGTGSAHTAQPLNFPPRPPNPVRTGRMRTSSDSPPDPDNLSMDGFERAYPSKTRRRH
jgi:hypothetical protein